VSFPQRERLRPACSFAFGRALPAAAASSGPEFPYAHRRFAPFSESRQTRESTLPLTNYALRRVAQSRRNVERPRARTSRRLVQASQSRTRR